MLDMFFPDSLEASAYDVDYEGLYKKGVRGLIFDIDNTLVPHGKPANKRAIELFRRLKAAGFRYCLLSNNKEERVRKFNEEIGADFIYKARKPLAKGYKKAMKLMGTKRESTVFIGDQLFTDVLGAKRLGIPNILVKPICPKEEIQIVIKRFFEKIVLYFFEKKGGG